MKIVLFGLIVALVVFLVTADDKPSEPTTMQSILDQYEDTTFYPYGFVEALLEYEQELLKGQP